MWISEEPLAALSVAVRLYKRDGAFVVGLRRQAGETTLHSSAECKAKLTAGLSYQDQHELQMHPRLKLLQCSFVGGAH